MEFATTDQLPLWATASVRLRVHLIMDSDFHDLDPATRHSGTGGALPVQIGNNVWLGSRVIVQKGVSIGDNSVIAAGAVVTRPVPANVVAGGNPARVIRELP